MIILSPKVSVLPPHIHGMRIVTILRLHTYNGCPNAKSLSRK